MINESSFIIERDEEPNNDATPGDNVENMSFDRNDTKTNYSLSQNTLPISHCSVSGKFSQNSAMGDLGAITENSPFGIFSELDGNTDDDQF